MVILYLPVEIKSVHTLGIWDEHRRVKKLSAAFLNCFAVVIFYHIIYVKIDGHIFKKVCVVFFFKNLDPWLRHQKLGRSELTEAERSCLESSIDGVYVNVPTLGLEVLDSRVQQISDVTGQLILLILYI